MDDDKGLSLVLVNSQKGLDAVREAGMKTLEVSYSDAIWKNSALTKSASKPDCVQEFWDIFNAEGIQEASKLLKRFEPSMLQKLRNFYVDVKRFLLD